MNTNNYAVLEVTREFLREVLHLPESATIVHVENALEYRWSVFFYIADKNLPEVKIGERAPFVKVILKTNYDPNCGHAVGTELIEYKIENSSKEKHEPKITT